MTDTLSALVSPHEDLRAALRSFLVDNAPVDRVITTMEQPRGYDRDTWTATCAGLGLAEVGIAEEFGGFGEDLGAELVVMEELGRSVFPGPFLARTLGATWLGRAASPSACDDLLPGLATGETVPGMVVTGGTMPVATKSEGIWRVRHDRATVLEGTCDQVLSLAVTEQGVQLFLLTASGLQRATRGVPLDQTRALSRVQFQHAPARLLSDPIDASALAAVEARLALLLAAEQIGAGLAAVELTVDYARTRRQFGRTIGSFQAVKHRLVNSFLELEAARAWCYALAAPMSSDQEVVVRHEAHGLASLAGAASLEAARTAVQVHGGIGFTWEHPAHVYLKRAKASSIYLGATSEHLDRAAAGLSGASDEATR